MKLFFQKNETGDIQTEIEIGTTLSDFDYVEMLKQLSERNEIDPDWGNLDEMERTKLQELLNKIQAAVKEGMNKPLE